MSSVNDGALAVLRSPERLGEITRLGLDRREPRPYLEEIVEALAAKVRADLVIMTAVLDETQVLLAARGPLPGWFRLAGQFPIEWSFCFPMVGSGQPLVVPDVAGDERFMGNPALRLPRSPRSYIGVPVVSSRGHMLGPLCAVGQEPGDFAPELVPFMRELAEEASARIEEYAT